MTNTNKNFRPLLASPAEDLSKLPYPMIGSPKVDGVRCVIHRELGPVTRSLKPIANHHARSLLSHELLKGLDGEITLGTPNAKDVFARSISAVMSRDGTPDITYHVFDCVGDAPYTLRLKSAEVSVKAFEALIYPIPCPIKLLPWQPINNQEDLSLWESTYVENGYEGLMLRRPDGPYKHGRSTTKEATLLKLKRFTDDEATITDFRALERNTNEPVRNDLGLQERSSHKAGKVADSLLGYLIVNHPTFGEFSIGSGFDVSLRQEIWNNKEKYRGQRICFKYQEIGVIDKPRFPIFKGFRPEE